MKGIILKELVHHVRCTANLCVIYPTGQMIWMTSISHMIFIGSPRLSSLNEMMERKMYLSDIPLYDVTRELVLLNQQRIAEIEVRWVPGSTCNLIILSIPSNSPKVDRHLPVEKQELGHITILGQAMKKTMEFIYGKGLFELLKVIFIFFDNWLAARAFNGTKHWKK